MFRGALNALAAHAGGKWQELLLTFRQLNFRPVAVAQRLRCLNNGHTLQWQSALLSVADAAAAAPHIAAFKTVRPNQRTPSRGAATRRQTAPLILLASTGENASSHVTGRVARHWHRGDWLGALTLIQAIRIDEGMPASTCLQRFLTDPTPSASDLDRRRTAAAWLSECLPCLHRLAVTGFAPSAPMQRAVPPTIPNPALSGIASWLAAAAKRLFDAKWSRALIHLSLPASTELVSVLSAAHRWRDALQCAADLFVAMSPSEGKPPADTQSLWRRLWTGGSLAWLLDAAAPSDDACAVDAITARVATTIIGCDACSALQVSRAAEWCLGESVTVRDATVARLMSLAFREDAAVSHATARRLARVADAVLAADVALALPRGFRDPRQPAPFTLPCASGSCYRRVPAAHYSLFLRLLHHVGQRCDVVPRGTGDAAAADAMADPPSRWPLGALLAAAIGSNLRRYAETTAARNTHLPSDAPRPPRPPAAIWPFADTPPPSGVGGATVWRDRRRLNSDLATLALSAIRTRRHLSCQDEGARTDSESSVAAGGHIYNMRSWEAALFLLGNATCGDIEPGRQNEREPSRKYDVRCDIATQVMAACAADGHWAEALRCGWALMCDEREALQQAELRTGASSRMPQRRARDVDAFFVTSLLRLTHSRSVPALLLAMAGGGKGGVRWASPPGMGPTVSPPSFDVADCHPCSHWYFALSIVAAALDIDRYGHLDSHEGLHRGSDCFTVSAGVEAFVALGRSGSSLDALPRSSNALRLFATIRSRWPGRANSGPPNQGRGDETAQILPLLSALYAALGAHTRQTNGGSFLGEWQCALALQQHAWSRIAPRTLYSVSRLPADAWCSAATSKDVGGAGGHAGILHQPNTFSFMGCLYGLLWLQGETAAADALCRDVGGTNSNSLEKICRALSSVDPPVASSVDSPVTTTIGGSLSTYPSAAPLFMLNHRALESTAEVNPPEASHPECRHDDEKETDRTKNRIGHHFLQASIWYQKFNRRRVAGRRVIDPLTPPTDRFMPFHPVEGTTASPPPPQDASRAS